MKVPKSMVKQMDEDELLKIVGDKLPVGVCIMQDGRFCYFNSNFPIATGYTADELVGMDSLEIVVPEDRKMVRKNTIKMLKRELLSPYQFRVIHKDGSIVWIMATVKSVQYHGRQAVLGNYMEITKCKQLEEALKASEGRYRELANSITDVFFAMDEHLRHTYWNKASEILTGIRAEDALGKSLREILPDTPGRRNAEGVYRNVLKTQQPQTFVNDFDIGGRHYIFEISAYPSPGGISVFVKDITERKQAEEKLEQSKENYRALFNSSVIGTVVRDAETMKIVMVNQAAVKMFGFGSPEEALEVDPFDFIFPEDRERYIELATKPMAEHEPHEPYEIRVITKGGREKWINVAAAMIMHESRLASLISFTDITEQRQQRERLMMTDRLASLGELAAGTAHELNNPLTSIIGFSQLLLEREVADDIREDLKLINNEAQRAASVTKNLLTFARQHAPVKQRNQINNIIEDALKLRAYEHKTNGIEVERRFAPDLPEVMVDHFQMQQVFMNIVINAEYFMIKAHNKGTLTITTKKQDDTVMISLADDGPGISPENLRRIFDPFFTTKEPGKGTGLGLSICHGIVTEHGGQIYAKSQLGKGATIFVGLPTAGS